MQKRTVQVGLQGMNQDIINPDVNAKQAYEIKNFRINATGHSNGIELTSERGTLQIPILHLTSYLDDLNEVAQASVTSKASYDYEAIGYCVLNKYLVVFMHGKYTDEDETVQANDMILRLELIEDSDDTQHPLYFQSELMYSGDLGFDADHRIEAIPCFESNSVQKVYWIDGKNYPRVINIVREDEDGNVGYNDFDEDEDPFSFYQKISSGSYNTITVSKSYVGGLFYAGVVQYAFSFYNMNAQETPVIYTTPLNYVSHSDRGEEPNKQLGCAFEVTVDVNPDDADNFDYVRVYSIYRSSVDGTPVVKVVKDIRCDDFTDNTTYYSYTFMDTNEQGYDYDAYRILVSSDHIRPDAIATKDAKMFLGNYDSDGNIVPDDSLIDTVEIEWKLTDKREISYKKGEDGAYYDHYNQTQLQSDEFKTFKYGEYYKFGLQFQDEYGNWSSVYPVNTSMNTKHPRFSDDKVYLPYAQSEAKLENIIKLVSGKGFVKARPVVSFPTLNERKILCQGIVNPTVFNITNRYDGTCHAQASWFFRPYPYEAKQNKTIVTLGTKEYFYGSDTYQYQYLLQSQILQDVITCIDNDLGSNTHCDEIEALIGEYEELGYYFDQDSDYTTVTLTISAEPTEESGYYIYGISAQIDAYLIPYYGGEQQQFQCHLSMIMDGDDADNFVGTLFYMRRSYSTSTITTADYYTGNERYKEYSPERFNGAVVQFQHYGQLYGSDDIGGEIQGMYFDSQDSRVDSPQRPSIKAYELTDDDDLQEYRNYFFVDQQICTLNSPEIDFNENLQNTDMSQYKMRIVGYIPFSSNYGKYNIIADSPLFKNDYLLGTKYTRGQKLASGFYDYIWKQKGGYHQQAQWCAGAQQVSAMAVWFDDVTGLITSGSLFVSTPWNEDSREVAYYAYPWNKQYLNNYSGGTITEASSDEYYEDTESSEIIKKVLANTKYADHTVYFDFDDEEGDINGYGINTDNINLFKYENTANALFFDKNMAYNGNVDSLLTYNSEYKLYIDGDDPEEKSFTGYPITIGHYTYPNSSNSATKEAIVLGSPDLMLDRMMDDGLTGDHAYFTYNFNSTLPIMMRYCSSKHVVFKISDDNGVQGILPVKEDSEYKIDDVTVASGFIWGESEEIQISQPEIDVDSITSYVDSNDEIEGYLWLGELYRDEETPYQDADYSSYKDRIWFPCGKEYDFTVDNNAYIEWVEGDTYFQRYDCLKTYPYSTDDYQSVVEIASFMVETHVNLDGRYDQNRGLLDNTYVGPGNFNLINPVYGQQNNFFQYQILDPERFRDTDFPTRVTWSLNKVNGQEVDEWTRTNTAAFMDLDGDKGRLTSLRRFGNQIYAFQESGISRIKYNENVALNTQNGTPIELGNSASVNGKEYVSETVGSQNKWSCVTTPNGIYFVDNHTPGIYRLGAGQNGGLGLNNITRDVLQRWFETGNADGDFIDTASYDANVDEVLFMFDSHNDSTTLAYQPRYGAFTAFYDYQGWVGNIGKHAFDIKDDEIHFLREGCGYNTFYGDTKDSWLTVVASPSQSGWIPSDCIFDNVWYRADTLDDIDNEMNYDEQVADKLETIPNYKSHVTSNWYHTFDKITVGNDYQYATRSESGDFIKKFRMWRVPIPRQGRARMRNSWLRIRLDDTSPVTAKTIIRDMYVDAFF